MVDDEEREEKKDLRLRDGIKKLFTAGVSGALFSEEGLLAYLSDVKLPKEAVQTILQGAIKSKEDITNILSREIMGFVSKMDWMSEFSKFATEHKFKITAEIEVTPRNIPPAKGDRAVQLDIVPKKKKHGDISN